MSIRLLALVTEAYGAPGGIAQYNRDLCEALAACGEVSEVVVVPRSGARARSAPPCIRQLEPQRGKLAYSASALLASHSLRPFDAVFCGHLFAAPVAAAAARLARVPLWLQLHGIEAWAPPPPWVRWGAEQARLVTAVSRHTRQLFLRWANVAPEAVRVLPNTFEARFTPGPKDEALLAAYGLKGSRVMLTVSRLAATERYKGHDLVLQALARLEGAHPDLVYAVAGDGDDRPRLEELARRHGVSERVRFLGFVGEQQLPALYRSADLFVMPSTGEGFGIVFLQARACGLPVVAGDRDGSRDPLEDGRAGRLLPPRVEAVAAAIDDCLSRPQPATYPRAFSNAAFHAHVSRLVARLARQEAAA